MPHPQIIALGGGGFSMEENPALDLYILAQTGVPNPKVCFVPTASGDAPTYIANFYAAFVKHPCRPSHLPFFSRTPDLRATLLDQDVIYVGGGNTKSMLAVWQGWGMIEVLREAWARGIVLVGVSAGAICWFEQGITDSVGGRLSMMACMGFLPGSCCPHYDGEPERRPAFYEFLGNGQAQPGLAVDDGAAVHFIGSSLHRVVASRPLARAYQMTYENGAPVETPLPAEYLGAS
ncbi:MAG: peptidase E [Anaerolineales bacterium]|nr:peptidase E [Anaerolineales bacterium]